MRYHENEHGLRGAEDRAQLVDQLLTSLCHVAGCSTELQQQALHDRLFGYAMRLADSSLASNAHGDAEAVFHLIKQRLTQQHRQDDAARLAELYQRLVKYQGLSSSTQYAILSILQQLADHGAGIPESRIAAYKPLQLPQVLQRKLCLSANAPSTAEQSLEGQRPRSLQQSGTAAAPHQQPTSSGLAMVKQPVLVKDVLRVVQGLTGQYIKFNSTAAGHDPAAAGSGVQVAGHDQLVLPVGLRTLLHELGELGVMYRRMQAAIAEGRRQHAGSVRQALCAALSEEVTDFYRLMAVLEGQLAIPQPVPGADASAAGPYLSLRRLQLWLAEPLRRMRLLTALVDGTAGRLGGDLAGGVWAACNAVGDPLASSYATRILHQMCVPLFDMVRHWVFEGVLEDAACEFFIVHNSSATAATTTSMGGIELPATGIAGTKDLWRDAYRIEPAKQPPFISADLAATILRAGKSINFLRDACGDARWVQEWAPAAAGAAAALGYGQLSVLERVVVSAGRDVDARLMAVLQSTGELQRHCQSIRRYLLLGQGDFVVALLDCLGAELNKAAKDVSEVTLNHMLRQALLASAGGGRGEEEGAQDRLIARKAPACGAESGWDVFSLQYQLGPPLSSIFTAAAQAGYSRLSRLLWLLRRTERSLGVAWHTLKVEIERNMPRFSTDPCVIKLGDLLRSFLRLRAEMAHFTINMQYYINLEVLECAWAEFMTASAAAPDLDCLITAHEEFLNGVLDRALLGPGKAEWLRATLQTLLSNCMGLQPLVARVNEKVQEGLVALDRRAATAAANTAAGRWGTTDEGPRQAVDDDVLTELGATLDRLAGQHRQLLGQYIKQLPDAANQVNAEVRFLLARLDFTDFYASSSQLGQESASQQRQ